ncbi:MAG: site-2 protease family protein [Armatimonadota bacterium]|nr:site-2 protease family protein [Armatimonadota bacterium]
MGGIRLGKLFGFEIAIDWSWLFIFFLVVYTLANGYFPSMYPTYGVAATWMMGLVAAVLLFLSVLTHEISHSAVARERGIPVRGIVLFLFGGMSQTADEPKTPRDEFEIAIAGPATSAGLGVLFYMLGGIGLTLQWPGPVVAVLGYVSLVNFLLAAFNLIPGFPLDGGRVLRSAVWAATGDFTKATRYASFAGQACGYVLIAVGFGQILFGALVNGLWLIFIGWFLAGAARASYQQALIRQALSGLRVAQIMTADVPVVPAETSVRQFIDNYLLRHDYSCYPVVSGDQVVGVVGIEEVRSIPSTDWDITPVGRIVYKPDPSVQVSADDDVWEALAKLANEDVCRLLVVEDGQLKGTLGKDSVFRLVQKKLQLGL